MHHQRRVARATPGAVMAWYAGNGGRKTPPGGVLFGDVNSSGKLPALFLKAIPNYPFYDTDAETIQYGYSHGYQMMDKTQQNSSFRLDWIKLTQYVFPIEMENSIFCRMENSLKLCGLSVLLAHEQGRNRALYTGCRGTNVDPTQSAQGVPRGALHSGRPEDSGL